MKKIFIGCFFMLSMFLGLQIQAEDSTEQLLHRNENVWFPMLRAKLSEAFNYNYEGNSYEGNRRFGELQDEVRNLFLEYFQTEESLLFDPAQFDTSSIHKSTNYIASDDESIRVFSWSTMTRYTRGGWDSLIQYRGSDGKLRTTSLSQMILNDINYTLGDATERYVCRIITLKEGVYLFYTHGLDEYMIHDFLTVMLKENTVVPYYAFNNKMQLRLTPPYRFPTSPMITDIQVFFEKEPFSIEITQLWLRNPEQFEYLDWERIKKEAFEHKERFIFNGVVFSGNYSLLIDAVYEGPVDIRQFFPEIESWESVIQQEHNEVRSENSAESETAFNTLVLSKQEAAIGQQKNNKTKNETSSNNHLIPLFILLFLVIIVCGIYLIKGKKKNLIKLPFLSNS